MLRAKSKTVKLLLVIFTLGIIASLSLVSIPGAEAGRSFTLAKGTCEHALRGSWSSNTNSKTQGTCSITNPTIIKSGVTMTIPQGVTLDLESQFQNNGSIVINSNQGIIIPSGLPLVVFYNIGTIQIKNSDGSGINSGGEIDNTGTITVINSGGYGIYNGGNIINYDGGVIDIISTAGTAGIFNIVSIDNYVSSTIKMRTSATNAISNNGLINNDGTICNTGNYGGIIPTSGNAVVIGCS